MSDNSPRSADRKFALIAPVVVGLVAVVVLVLLLTRQPPPPPTPAPVVAEAPPLVAAPPAPTQPAAATRTDLIAAAARASDAYAAGAKDGSGRDLVGRRFRVRLTFGCGGPAGDPGSAQAYYQYDRAGSALRLVARPAVWTELPLVRAAPTPSGTESVEGFWLPRPWLTSEGCPTRRTVAPPATPTPVEAPTLGLAMLHAAEASRVERRGQRPYEHVIKLAPENLDQAPTFGLVLEGKVSGFADGAAIHCWSESAEHRPVCLYAVDIDRVAFEDAKATVLADWPR